MDPSSSSNPPLPPLRNPRFRHISKSASKRESVQLLGSIKDLQARFSQAGLVEHWRGAGAGVKSSSLGVLGEEEDISQLRLESENRPPSDDVTKRRERRAWKEVELVKVDPVQAGREARDVTRRLRALWRMESSGSPTSPTSGSSSSSSFSIPSPDHHLDMPSPTEIRHALVGTAQAIRQIRTLALATSYTHTALQTARRVSGSILPRPSKLRPSFSTPSRPSGMPRAVSLGLPERKSSLGVLQESSNSQDEDAHADLRKAAWEVLAGLRTLEERLRTVPLTGGGQDPLDPPRPHSGRDTSPASETGEASSSSTNDIYTTAGSSTSSANETFTTAATTLRPSSALSDIPPGKASDLYLVDDETEYNLNAMAEPNIEEKQMQTWEERIVAENREYSVTSEEEWQVVTQGLRRSVEKWMGVVEKMFLGSKVGPGDESWVKAELWDGRSRERLHAFLCAYLPLHLQLLVPSVAASDFHSAFLSRLSDGYLLIQSYNAVIRASTKPWGFIPDEDVHDTVSGAYGGTTPAEDASGKEWTFRRVGNLTCWAAALRLRYNLPIHIPTSSTSSSFLPPPPSTGSGERRSPSTSPGSTLAPLPSVKVRDAERIVFDPVLIAKRGDGWEESLEGLLNKWLDEAAREARGGFAITSIGEGL